jgi:hypothetical protein
MGDEEELSDRDKDRILSEQLWFRLDAIREAVSLIPGIDERLRRVEGDVTEIKGELVVHREILREHSADLKEIKTIVAGQQEAITELKLASHTH